ncbi:MAG: ATP synthase F1 subunit gamma [Pseudomonadota bacterium]|nr:ATP synthase F1 subunit gamma [Pseudomonadota bacterium]
MSQLREIKRQIGSVRKTRTITEAMQRIAFIKMGYARQRAEAVRPYSRALLAILARLMAVNPDYQPPLMRRSTGGGVGVLLVTTDKGLCGPLNLRLLQVCLRQMASWEKAGRQVCVTVIGSRGAAAMRRAGVRIVAEASGVTGDVLESEELLGALAVPLHQFVDGDISELYIATNRFQNMLVHEPMLERLLPADPALITLPEGEAATTMGGVDYLYEPEPRQVIDVLLARYVESTMFRAVAENLACEHCARMTAMKAATDNATHVIEELTMNYNKMRQETITREIIEITAGADALQGGGR